MTEERRDFLKKFTLKDILLLLDWNVESEEKVVIAEQCEENTWSILPMNSKLLWVEENLDRHVESISIWNGMIQIWLMDEENK